MALQDYPVVRYYYLVVWVVLSQFFFLLRQQMVGPTIVSVNQRLLKIGHLRLQILLSVVNREGVGAVFVFYCVCEREEIRKRHETHAAARFK